MPRRIPTPSAWSQPDGSYGPNVPLFAGKRILTPEGKDGDANGAVIKELIEAGKLLAKGTLRHSYPHSWRSKAPVIFRATPQWFVAIDKPMPGFGNKTLARTGAGGHRRDQMVSAARARTASAPWWKAGPTGCCRASAPGACRWRSSSRKRTGEVLNDAAVFQRIAEAFENEGADAWFTSPPERFLGEGRKRGRLRAGQRHSGCLVRFRLDPCLHGGKSHRSALAARPSRPIFISKAPTSIAAGSSPRCWNPCGTRGRAPYKGVLTHGFVLDEQGRKMSKSLGNTLAPQVIAEKNGAEILRLWAASSDFTEDLRIGQDIIKANVDAYRRLRNTIRFMLANLAGFDEKERIGIDEMPELERFMLARLAELDAQVREGYAAFDFNRVTATLFNFCTNDLSAFYFDIRKDVLYCDARDAPRRRAARTVMDEIFRRIVTWFAPILCFTMEEAWLSRFPAKTKACIWRLSSRCRPTGPIRR